MANSNPENATINANGNNDKKKKIIPDVIILYVNPLKILSNMCPDNMLAANLNPSETFLDKYDINSIITNKGKRASGQPAGTKNAKNLIPCMLNPSKVAPNTTVKLKEKVNIK